MKLECSVCTHSWDGTIAKIGKHNEYITFCPNCRRFITTAVPEGSIVMAFAANEVKDAFTTFMDPSACLISYYAFSSPEELLEVWDEKVKNPDSQWYWIYDDAECVCSGACDPADIDAIKQHFRIENISPATPVYTEKEIREKLWAGLCLNEILTFCDGQECQIYKADRFYPDETVIYVPDLDLNYIPTNIRVNEANSLYDANPKKWEPMPAKKQIENEIMSCCYTGADFLHLCNGDENLARRLFAYVDWQHPSSALPEMQED